MRYPVVVPGMEGQSVEVVTSQLTDGTKVMVNGLPAPTGKQRGEFILLLPDGQRAVIQIIPKLAFDTAIRITVNGVPQVLGTPLNPLEIGLAWLPVLLIFIGGLIGGVCAGLAVSVNLALFRSKYPVWLKYFGALAMTTCALLLYLLISVALYRRWHPTAPVQPDQTTASIGPNRETVGAEDLALASKGATATSDSELSTERGCTPKIIDGLLATPGDFSDRWHSSIDTPHPHWIQVRLPRPENVGRVVIHFADPQGYATSFQGLATVNGRNKVLFDVTTYHSGQSYDAKITPIRLDTFRLIIRKSANPAYPNAAQVSEIAIYPPIHK